MIEIEVCISVNLTYVK